MPVGSSLYSGVEDHIELHPFTDVMSSPGDDFERPLPRTQSPLVNTGPTKKKLILHIGTSFFLFGLINNVLYVIILSAALDLVPPSTPKGIIAFCNIAPAFVAKVGWPYILKGRIRYFKRLVSCCLMSSVGMIIVASSDSLHMRLLGISLASFSSGLGELTFLQLSTTYHPSSVAGHCVGYFASGTGAAGLVGAFMWWELRKLGVRIGVGISSVMPFVILAAYAFVLPPTSAFIGSSLPESYDDEDVGAPRTASYAPIPVDDTDEDENETANSKVSRIPVALTASDKWRLVKPMFWKYMLPLFCVYTFEYTINQGIAPTLVYPVPAANEYFILSHIIHSIRDYYPLWQLVYQFTVFLSRSSISLGIPPLPEYLLFLPAVIQLGILLILAVEAGIGVIPDNSEGLAIVLVFLLISLEGICGGSAYVNVFYRINQEEVVHSQTASESEHMSERALQEKEFKIGSVGFADSTGILLASLLAMPTEIGLCRAQVSRGKTLCQQL